MTPVRLLRATGDDALARRASRGDQEAFGVLFGRYQRRLELYCRSILRHDEDARDATQNAMAKAFVALGGREQDVAVRAWLFRIAHNESISLMRRRRPTAELAEDLSDVTAGSSAPVEAAELREELAQVLGGIRELPPRARQALLLRELADLDYPSVGQVLGITAGGARQAVFEARTALQADRAGREAPCDTIRRELSEADHRRRPTRHVRGHLRGCDGCRTWSRAQDTRRERLSALPDAGLAGGSLWAWLTGALGVGAGAGAGAGAGGVATLGGGGLLLNAKVTASLAALVAGAAPVAVHEVERRLHVEDAAAAAAVVSTPAAASPRTRTATPVAAVSRSSGTSAATRAVANQARQETASRRAARDGTARADDRPTHGSRRGDRDGARAAGRLRADPPRWSQGAATPGRGGQRSALPPYGRPGPHGAAGDGRRSRTGATGNPAAADTDDAAATPTRAGQLDAAGPATQAGPQDAAGPMTQDGSESSTSTGTPTAPPASEPAATPDTTASAPPSAPAAAAEAPAAGA